MNAAQIIVRFSWVLGFCAVLLLMSASVPLSAHAYFSGDAQAESATLSAGSLSVALASPSALSVHISSTTNATATFSLTSTGTVVPQYRLSAQKDTCSSAFYDGLSVAVVVDHSLYGGSLKDMVATTTVTGAWSITIFSGSAIALPNNTCDITLHIDAWQQGFASPDQGGFTKELAVPLTVRADGYLGRTVVLNEILPHPDTSAPAPANHEFIELFNTSSAPVDVAGWTISEISGPSEKAHTIVSAAAATGELEPYGGTSLIAPNAPVAFVFGGSKTYLNNDGDTVKLYDSEGVLRDEFTYPSSVEGDSYARYPDGVGPWVDPVPTPGKPNVDTPLPPKFVLPAVAVRSAVASTSLETQNSTSTIARAVTPDVSSTTPIMESVEAVERAATDESSAPEVPGAATSTELVAPQTSSERQVVTQSAQEGSSAPPESTPESAPQSAAALLPLVTEAALPSQLENLAPASEDAATSSTS